MENDRWSWFAGGLVLGLIIGLGIAAGVAWPQLQAAQARAEEAEAIAAMEVERALAHEVAAHHAARQAKQHAQDALDQLKLAQKQADEERARIKALEEAQKKDR